MGVQNFTGVREVMPLCPITEAKQDFDLPIAGNDIAMMLVVLSAPKSQ